MASQDYYTTADEFLENEKPKVINGIKCFTVGQFAKAIQMSPATARRWADNGRLEETLGAASFVHPVNRYRLFPENAVRKVFEMYEDLTSRRTA